MLATMIGFGHAGTPERMLIDKRVGGHIWQKDLGAENWGLQGMFCLHDLHWAVRRPCKRNNPATELHQPYRYRECFFGADTMVSFLAIFLTELISPRIARSPYVPEERMPRFLRNILWVALALVTGYTEVHKTLRQSSWPEEWWIILRPDQYARTYNVQEHNNIPGHNMLLNIYLKLQIITPPIFSSTGVWFVFQCIQEPVP